MAKPQQRTEGQSPAKKMSSIVKPLIRDGNHQHALEKLFDGPEVPMLKSIGYASLGPGEQWVSYVITSRGRDIISIEVAEPNMRAIAEEASKINFVNELVDREQT